MLNLAGLDLNLLVTLDALLREKSVTRAARDVGLSQPAMSHALARLRELLGDALLVRAGRRMETTPRAEALRQPLASALAHVREVFEGGPRFDPTTSQRQFRISGGDLAELVLLPPLAARLSERARGIDLHFPPPTDDLGGQLDRAEVRRG